MVSASDLQSGGPELESRSDHLVDLFFGNHEFNSSTTPAEVMFDLDYLIVVI